jgi:hypothetical protein
MIRLCLSISIAAVTLFAAAAEDKPPQSSTFASTGESAAPFAVQVKFNAYIAEPVAGHEYRFLYQLRLHTKKGELGPVLGDSARPAGKAFDLGPLSKGRGVHGPLLEFDGSVDVTRKDLSAMTNLPKNARNAVIRVEPQVYDQTADAFLTPAKSPCVLLFVDTDEQGRVLEVRPFADWFLRQFGSAQTAQAALRLVGEVDAWEQRDYEFPRAFENVFSAQHIKADLKVLAVRGMPARLVHEKNKVRPILEELAAAGNAQLKAAVEAKLAEAKCELGDRNACRRLEEGSQEARQRASQMGGAQGPAPQGSQGSEPPSQLPSTPGGPPTPGGAALPQSWQDPTPVSRVGGNRCNALAPRGWHVVDERNEGDGVDFVSPDATLAAGYLIVGIPEVALPAYGGTPENAVKFIQSAFGQMPTQFSPSHPTETGFNVIQWRNQIGVGLSLWYTFQFAQGDAGFVLVVRSAAVTAQGNQQRLREAVAVATSIRCVVGLRAPPPPDYTSRSDRGGRRPRTEDEAASEYNAQLGMEYAHDKTTGENYWVSPSTNFRQDGPEGPGYYKQVGNEVRKLAPGRSD